MIDRADILAEITAIAPAGAPVDDDTLARLRELSAALVAVSADSVTEFGRYLSVMDREIEMPNQLVADHLAGRTVLVTGASGCIGSALLSQLARYRPARVITLDVAGRPAYPHTTHCRLDIRDRDALLDLVAAIRPDVVFHQAAQRDPALAERAVHRTVATNVLGTRNLVEACARAEVSRLVHASTGKAQRPYTTDVYAASKRAAELIVADAATRGVQAASAARFTHVVDNAIVLSRFRAWCSGGEAIRVHSADLPFYAQSALEAAQLLLVAAVAAEPPAGPPGLELHAIRNLDWPISVLDVAIGVMAEHEVTPLLITGHDPGYEEQAYPGLYDPAVAGGVSPLINAFEAPGVRASASTDVDAVTCRLSLSSDAHRHVADLDALCAAGPDPGAVRAGLDRLSRALLHDTLDHVDPAVLRRVRDLTRQHRSRLNATNAYVDRLVRARATGSPGTGAERGPADAQVAS